MMRFSIQNLCWLTIAVALGSWMARSVKGDVPTIVLAGLGLAYLTAPLLLALASSFFQSIPSHRRATGGYWLLLVLAAIPTLLLGIFSPAAAVVFAGLTATVWVIQIEIFSSIHENQQ